MVCGHIEFGLKQRGLEIDKKIVAESSSDKNGSLHILYKIKDKIFAKCARRRLHAFLPTEAGSQLPRRSTYMVNMCVYSRNRLFPMLGCTKKHEKGPKRVEGQDFNYDNWLDSIVQPLTTKDEIMKMYEPDESPRGTSPPDKWWLNNYVELQKKIITDDFTDLQWETMGK